MMRYVFDTSYDTLRILYSLLTSLPLHLYRILHQAQRPVQQRVQYLEVHQAQISLHLPRLKAQQRVLEVDQASLPDPVLQRQSLRATDSLKESL